MRSLLHLLTWIALLAAPLAAPVAAMAHVTPSAGCASMADAPMNHPMPARHHGNEPCCVALPMAVAAPAAVLTIAVPVPRLSYATANRRMSPGSDPLGEDPPPRLS